MLTATNQPMFRFLAVLTAASMVGMQGYTILFNNFAVETVHLEGFHVGLTQSIREIPGFLALTAIYVMLIIREHRLAAFSIVLLGVGVGLTGLFPSFAGVAFTTLLMSFGFHYYETVNQSLTLQYFSTHQSPLVMGKLRSLAAITSIISAAVIWCLGFVMGYTGIVSGGGGGGDAGRSLGGFSGPHPCSDSSPEAADGLEAPLLAVLCPDLHVRGPTSRSTWCFPCS